MRRAYRLVLSFALVSAVLLPVTPIHAQEDEEVCSPGITLDMPIRGIIIDPTPARTVLDFTICNGTDERQLIDIEMLSVPAEWTVGAREPFETFRVSFLSLEPGTDKKMELRVELPETLDVDSGDYVFTMRLSTSTGGVIEEAEVRVEVSEAEEVVAFGGVVLQATYPVLRGPSTSRFDFDVGVKNETFIDGVFDLTAEVPSGWEVYFTPAFGADRETTIISTLSIPFGVTQRVKVRVTPTQDTPPGQYLVRFTAGNEDYQAQMVLGADVTGIFDVRLVPETGLLSIDATAGDEEPMFMLVQNLGTGILQQLALTADPPEGWQVTFDPTGVELVDPLTQQRVEVGITPAKDAIPGDYFVRILTRNLDANDFMDIRVTVEQSTIWGWFGIGIVVLVLGGLVGLFVRLGRR